MIKLLIMIKYFLQNSYALSLWFSKEKDKIVPGTAYLFLTSLSFVLVSIWFVVTKVLSIQMNALFFAGITGLIILLIMLLLNKLIVDQVHSFKLAEGYNKLSKGTIYIRRLIGFVMFAGSFILMFVVGIISFSK